MDPVTAACQAIVALATLGTELVKGQPPDVKAAIWTRLDGHMARIYDLFHHSDAPPKGPPA